jgi:hypothetical protein
MVVQSCGITIVIGGETMKVAFLLCIKCAAGHSPARFAWTVEVRAA